MPRWRYDAQPLLRYATVAEAPLYREIMEIFAQAAAGYASRLSPEDVHAALLARLGPGVGEPAEDVPSIAEVKERVEQLSHWGNLSQDFDTGRATSLESYERTAYVYDLTPGGEAAFEALATLDEALRRVGGLQAVALRQIEEMLGQLVTALRATTQDADRVFALCEDLHARFKGLTANASLFMQKVNRLLAAPVLDARDFALFKADTITYLHYHGDFDWPGLAIGGTVINSGALPWRFGSADYRAGLALNARPKPLPAPPREAQAPWDLALLSAMRDHLMAVEEETFVDLLLADLAAGRPGTDSTPSGHLKPD